MKQVSVIIPTYNRPKALERCLDALALQSLAPRFWEVVLVNDGGLPLEALLAKYANKLHICYITQKNSGPASARNVGAAHATAQLIAFLDDDCLPEKTWLEQMVKEAKPGVIVGGKVVNFYQANLYSEASQVLLDFLYAFNAGRKDAFFTSNNFCLYRADFMKVEGFSTAFTSSAGEDREFCVRAAHRGIKLLFMPEIRIGHAHELNFNSFCRLHKKYGFAALHYQRVLQAEGIKIDSTPRLLFYLKMFQFPFIQAKYSISQKVLLAFLLAISQLFVAIGFFQHKMQAAT